MTSPLYQSTPTLLPGTVTSDFSGGVASVAVAPQVVEGVGGPTGVVTAPAGSVYTNSSTGDVYSNSDGTSTGWTKVGGSTAPVSTKGDLYGFSTVGARIPVGANGKVLTAKSGVALGVEWDDIPAPDLSAYELSADAAATFVPKALARTGASSTQVDGGTFNVSSDSFNALHFAADVAAFTVGINTPTAGHIVRFGFDKAVTTLTVTVAGGYSIVGGAPTSAVAGSVFAYILDDFNQLYWPIK